MSLPSGLYLGCVGVDGKWAIYTMSTPVSAAELITQPDSSDPVLLDAVNYFTEKFTVHLAGQQGGQKPDNGWGINKYFQPGSAHSEHDFNIDLDYNFDILLTEINDVISLSYYLYKGSDREDRFSKFSAKTYTINQTGTSYSYDSPSDNKVITHIQDRLDPNIVDKIIVDGNDIEFKVSLATDIIIGFGPSISYDVDYKNNVIVATVSGCNNVVGYKDLNLDGSRFGFVSSINNSNIFNGMTTKLSSKLNGTSQDLTARIQFDESVLESNGVSFTQLGNYITGSGYFELRSYNSARIVSISPYYNSSISLYTPTSLPIFDPDITGLYGQSTIGAIIPNVPTVKYAYYVSSINGADSTYLIDRSVYSPTGIFSLDFTKNQKDFLGKSLKLRVFYDSIGSNSYVESEEIYPFYDNYYNLTDVEIKFSGVAYEGDPVTPSGYESVWFTSTNESIKLNNLDDTFYSAVDPVVYVSFSLAPNLTHITGTTVDPNLMPRPATAYLIAMPYNPASVDHQRRFQIYFNAPWQLGTGLDKADQKKLFPSVRGIHAVNMLNQASLLGGITTYKTLALGSIPFTKTAYETNSYMTLTTGKYGLFLIIISEPDSDPTIVTNVDMCTAYCISNPGSDATFEVPVRVK